MIWLLLALGVLALAAYPFWRESRRKPMDAQARKSAPGQFVQLSDGLVHFEWIGPLRGPVAVCIHGQTTPSVVWKGLAPGLAALGYRVLIYDHYGRGYSDRPAVKSGDAPALLLRQLDELLDVLGARDDLTVLGFSMGGAVAAMFAAAHPGRIRQMVILGSGGLRNPELSRAQKMITWPLGIGKWLYMLIYAAQFRKYTDAERDLPGTVPNIVDLQQEQLDYRGFIPAVRAFDLWFLANDLRRQHERIARDGIPLMAIFGAEDAVVPLGAIGNLVAWNRNARIEQIPGAGHGLPYTHSAEILTCLTDFLRHPDT